MRKTQKKQAEEFIVLLEQVHREIKRAILLGDISEAQELLAQCQEGAIELGGLIGKTEGEGFITISYLEDYCEKVYQVYQKIEAGTLMEFNVLYDKLQVALLTVAQSVKNDINVRKEVVFLPYKASMWDSLESVYLAAKEDKDCDAYCIPIPYYDKDENGNFKAYHYEGEEYPEAVSVTWYEDYDFEAHRPDAIFIHNPYDDCNYVTSVAPFFYSKNLKKFTECLVYIPYYATAGGMSEAQALCPAYLYADYIVIQSEKHRKYFDSRIPNEKFLPFGSPKFDSVIQKCQNPPKPPIEWEEKMQGKKVYFYNTSINGMLEDTEAFLKKMEYVFDIFKVRKDACLLWRPHPLLDSTFDAMRKMYEPRYEALKKQFLDDGVGIYDTTSNIENAIALSDVYIGDMGTSVTSLFGVAGKPLFVLNNHINTLPEEDDWKGEVIGNIFSLDGDDRWIVAEGNKLWHSEKNDYHYKYYCDLNEFATGNYYLSAFRFKDKVYVTPYNARDIVVIHNKRIKRIALRYETCKGGAFFSSWHTDKYLFLIPNNYPVMVRFNFDTEELIYIEGVRDFIVKDVGGKRVFGGTCIANNTLVMASPVNNSVLMLDIEALTARTISTNSKSNLGCCGIVPEGDNLWLLPLNGKVLSCWNSKTGEIHEYDSLPETFQCLHPLYNTICEEMPFGNIAFFKEKIIISPNWGNMYISLDRNTGKMEEWKLPIKMQMRGKNEYYRAGGMGGFITSLDTAGNYSLRYTPERKLYRVNIETKECTEIAIVFDLREIKEQSAGFKEQSEWLQYCCRENALNSLIDLLDDTITGNLFNKERQIEAFCKINAAPNGDSGQRIYQFINKCVLEK